MSEKHSVFVSSSSNSASQQAKQKFIWVQKGSSSCCVASEDFTNSTSIDVALGDIVKPFSEQFLESNLSLPSSSYSTNPHPPNDPPISVNQQTKSKCIWVRKGASPHCLATEDHKSSINIKIIPGVLERPFSSSSPESSSSSSEKPPSPKSPPIFKPTLSYWTTHQNKTKYIVVKKGALPLYIVPRHIQKLIKRGIVPKVLRKPLSPLTYKDYFAALLYAEDYYFEVSKEKISIFL